MERGCVEDQPQQFGIGNTRSTLFVCVPLFFGPDRIMAEQNHQYETVSAMMILSHHDSVVFEIKRIEFTQTGRIFR